MHSCVNVLQHIKKMRHKGNLISAKGSAKLPQPFLTKISQKIWVMAPSVKCLLWMQKPKDTSLDLQHPYEWWMWWLTSICPVQEVWRQVDP